MKVQPRCPKCRGALDVGGSRCLACDREVELRVLPASSRPSGVLEGVRLAAEDQASCFYHEGRQAEHACDQCGRFVCRVCALDQPDGSVLCSNCLAGRLQGSAQGQPVSRPFRYDQLAAGIGLLSLLFFPVAIFIAPAGLLFCLVKRRRWRQAVTFSLPTFLLSTLLGLLCAAGSVAFLMAVA